ncbi:hypothetical protein ASE36_19410 [Rhizobium sp. Root274]|uniref:hypothetical protein n=1 Tax=unclassified Rhizobium TaxID=2613769 RepID=UPI0007137E86|nr:MULTISPECIES: hypothetical protein [unclassified Rhizobium]KQW26962.1 hypothetical protein ASC71_19665 [Rhizobium sp. Root1240]KRD27976.1 hypothetical protein ASE36_19410 [Rhizobium sp. Root274]
MTNQTRTDQTLSRPVMQTVPQTLLHLFATLTLSRTQGGALDQINALPGHLRRDLGLADTVQSITFVNDGYK